MDPGECRSMCARREKEGNFIDFKVALKIRYDFSLQIYFQTCLLRHSKEQQDFFKSEDRDSAAICKLDVILAC